MYLKFKDGEEKKIFKYNKNSLKILRSGGIILLLCSNNTVHRLFNQPKVAIS